MTVGAFAVVGLATVKAFATSPELRTSAMYVSEADIIARVTVSGVNKVCPAGLSTNPCRFVYVAEVVEVLKGSVDGKALTFFSFQDLELGRVSELVLLGRRMTYRYLCPDPRPSKDAPTCQNSGEFSVESHPEAFSRLEVANGSIRVIFGRNADWFSPLDSSEVHLGENFDRWVSWDYFKSLVRRWMSRSAE